jgi:hypothetical protein
MMSGIFAFRDLRDGGGGRVVYGDPVESERERCSWWAQPADDTLLSELEPIADDDFDAAIARMMTAADDDIIADVATSPPAAKRRRPNSSNNTNRRRAAAAAAAADQPEGGAAAAAAAAAAAPTAITMDQLKAILVETLRTGRGAAAGNVNRRTGKGASAKELAKQLSRDWIVSASTVLQAAEILVEEGHANVRVDGNRVVWEGAVEEADDDADAYH